MACTVRSAQRICNVTRNSYLYIFCDKTAQIDRAVWTEEMLDLLTEWIRTDPKGEPYRALDWSPEYRQAKEADPNASAPAL